MRAGQENSISRVKYKEKINRKQQTWLFLHKAIFK